MVCELNLFSKLHEPKVRERRLRNLGDLIPERPMLNTYRTVLNVDNVAVNLI